MSLPDTVGGYRVERLLGRGGMAAVYLARDDAGGRVALKWLHRASPTQLLRFAAEVAYLERLDHPNVVRYLGHGSWEGRPYVLMEYVEGQDLRVYAEKLRSRPPVERQVRAREIARSLCRALAHVHAQGLVHRDVKPSNVLLGGDGRVVLTDFGVATAADEGPLTAVGVLVGTAAYAAPEQLRGEPIDARVDQYGLGCTLYHLLTGRRPFEEEATPALLRAHLDRAPRPPSERDPTIAPDLEAFVLRLMAKDPDHRYRDMIEAEAVVGAASPEGLPLAGRQATIDAIAAALDRVAAGEGVVLRLVGATGSGRSWMQALAHEAADRRGLACVAEDEPLAVEAARRRIAAGEALLVVTTRDVPGARVAALPALTVADLRRSVYALAPQTKDLARVAERLHRESGGNAGMFVELVERYREGDRVELPEGPLQLDADRWTGGMDLDEEAVAGVLAALEVPADVATLSDVSGVPAEGILPRLAERGVASPAGDRWVLAAEVLRAPLLALVPDPEGLAQRVREVTGSTEAAPDDALLGEVAGLRAAGRLAEAEARLMEGVSEAPTAPRLLALGAVLWSAGANTRARTMFEEALAVAGSPSLRARAATGAGACALQAGELSAALDRLTEAVTEAGLAREEGRMVLALLNLAEARAVGGELAEALRTARRALAIAEGLRDRALECAALRHYGQVLLDVGLAAEAGRRLADASALARAAELHEERVAAHALRARAALEERASSRTAAAAALDRLLPLLGEERPDPEGFRLLVRCVWAQAAASLGDARMYQRARAEADPSLAGRRLSVRMRADLLLARAALLAEEPADAVARATRVKAEAEPRGFRLLAWEAERVLARAANAALPPPGELATGLTEEERAAMERRG
ncbi:MAG: BREX system ATP-binding domain-containing protein [Myxococcota bacterium]